MRRNALHTFILVAVALACCLEGQTVAARSKKKAKAVKTAVTADTLSYADSRRFGYFFLEAVNQQNAGHYAAAFDLLNHCLDINPNAAEVYFMRSRYYGSLHKDSLALRDLETAARLQPSNSTYQESVAQQYIGTGNFAKATEAYEELLATHRDRDDVVEILIQLYRQQKDYPKMLSAINRLEQIDGSSDQLTMMRMNAYEMMGDEKHAYATLKGLAAPFSPSPSFGRAFPAKSTATSSRSASAASIATDPAPGVKSPASGLTKLGSSEMTAVAVPATMLRLHDGFDVTSPFR